MDGCRSIAISVNDKWREVNYLPISFIYTGITFQKGTCRQSPRHPFNGNHFTFLGDESFRSGWLYVSRVHAWECYIMHIMKWFTNSFVIDKYLLSMWLLYITFLPALFRIWKTKPLVALEISALPCKSCALTPSPAVMRSLLSRRHRPGFCGRS